MKRTPLFLALPILFIVLAVRATAADPPPPSDAVIWGALIRGSNQQLLSAEQSVASDLADRLGKAFPFEFFELKGEHTQLVFREYESWVVPSRELFLKIDSKGPAEGGGMSLNLQLWREMNILVKTDVVLKNDSPLFIAGPKWGQDQLFFIVELRPKPEVLKS